MNNNLNGPNDPDGIDERIECPTCRKLVESEDLRTFDFGIDRDNGHNDSGIGCTECEPVRILFDRWEGI